MADETEQIILADAAASAVEEPPRRRGIFRRRRRPKLPDQPLTHCENCGAALAGEFCAQCGQHAIEYRRSLGRVVIDALDSFLNWDTKFLRSVGILLIRPGKLTNDFNAGQRVRYVHPLRLYLLASIAFFLMARLLNIEPGTDAIDLSQEDRAELNAELEKLFAPGSPLSEEQRARIADARIKFLGADVSLTPDQREDLDRAVMKLPRFAEKSELQPKDVERLDEILDRITKATAPPEASPAASPPEAAPGSSPPPGPEASPATKPIRFIHFGSDSDRPPTPFEAWLEERRKEKLGEDGTKAGYFIQTLRNNIPTMMLFCIPLFAFVLKLLYIFKRRYYVEHLVYALHIHSFVYLGVVVISLLAMAAKRWVPGVETPLTVILSFVVLAQVFISLRRVYRQGWIMTTLKFYVGGVVYLVVLSFAVAITAIVTFLLP